jgi:hypothetical protein
MMACGQIIEKDNYGAAKLSKQAIVLYNDTQLATS